MTYSLTYTWAGNSGTWSDSADWTNDGAPGYDSGQELVLLNGTGAYTIDTNSGLLLGAVIMSDPNATWDLISPPPGGTHVGLTVGGSVDIQAGTLVLGGRAYINATGATTLDAGATITATGANTADANLYAFDNDGQVFVNTGATLDIGIGLTAAVNDGTIAVNDGTLVVELMTATGTLTLADHATLSFTYANATSAGGAPVIDFLDANSNKIILVPQKALTVPIENFQAGDTIELDPGFTDPSLLSSQWNGSQLTIDYNGTQEAALTLTNSGPTVDVTATIDPSNDIDIITTYVACFAQGTRIATPRGEIPVEFLRPGDTVILPRRAAAAPVIWIGQRSLDCRRHPRPHDVCPVRIAAGAFAPGRPARDLLLSPDHAVYVENVLIPVRYLLNGATITREPAGWVTYWHVELAAHDILLAENLPAESYLDTGNRAAFNNGGPALHMHPDFAMQVWRTGACARLVLDGLPVVAAKQRLLDRTEMLGHALTDDPGLIVVADERVLDQEIVGATRRVRLPPSVRSARLLSRAWVPAHTRATENDTRSLGVAVAKIALDEKEISLDDARLSLGWQAPEGAWRWTDGDAEMTLAGVRELRFDVVMTGSYWHVPQSGRDQNRMRSWASVLFA